MSFPVTITSDVAYANDDDLQKLDLYRPDVDDDVPVVVYLHGGGWQVGDKTADAKERLERLASFGVAVASANYRLVPDATYPTQIHDAKAAVRWLRAHGAEHGLAVDKIGAWGASAGGYLATMLGVSNGDSDLEGAVGQNSQSSYVDAVVDWFGQSDLRSNSTRSWLEREILNPPFEEAFLQVKSDTPEAEDALTSASPLLRVTRHAPPFLIVHGDRDRVTPIQESAALHDALVRHGVPSTFVTLGGAGHESHTFDREDHLAMTAAFLRTHLSTTR